MSTAPFARARRCGSVLFVAALPLLLPSAAIAQHADARPRSTILVTVTSATAETVDAAEVSVLQRGRTLAAARTASDGTARLVVAADTGAVEIAARKIGFRPQARFVRAAAGETTVVSVRLVRAVQQLDDVRVSARESARRRSYYLDAETIAGSGPPIRSALDAIAVLRPDMLTSRGSWRVCGTIKEVWVNGRRIPQNVEPDPMLRHRQLPGVSPKAPVPPAVLAHPEPHPSRAHRRDDVHRLLRRRGAEDRQRECGLRGAQARCRLPVADGELRAGRHAPP